MTDLTQRGNPGYTRYHTLACGCRWFYGYDCDGRYIEEHLKQCAFHTPSERFWVKLSRNALGRDAI